VTEAKPASRALRRRTIDGITLRNLSPATQRSFLHAVTKFSCRFGCSPDRLGLEDVGSFQVHLVAQGISCPALNQTVCVLRFFYGMTLDGAGLHERMVYARTPRKLPAILSADEIVRFLVAVRSLKTRVALTTAYAAGLRASDAVSLNVADIDSARMVLQVRHGKGAKESVVMFSAALLPGSGLPTSSAARSPQSERTLAPNKRLPTPHRQPLPGLGPPLKHPAF
jgi:integrase/recombinase XerD